MFTSEELADLGMAHEATCSGCAKCKGRNGIRYAGFNFTRQDVAYTCAAGHFWYEDAIDIADYDSAGSAS